MKSVTVAAADLGAASGRVMIGRVDPGALTLTEAHRFENEPVRTLDTLHWDALGLYRGVLTGLRAAGRLAGGLDGVGVDTWAVDYGLLDYAGALLGNPVHYRDARTDGVLPAVLDAIPAAELYATTGLQLLPFNTIYQLVAAQGSPQLDAARRLLLMPDLLCYWLTGAQRAELTNASTTQLLDVTRRAWSAGLIRRVGLDPALFPAALRPRRPDRRARPVGPGRHRPGRPRAGDRGRLARHRVGRGGRAGPRRAVRLHLLRHLVPGRRGARPAGAERGQPRGQLQQRTRRRRHGPLPAQRDGPLAAPGMPAGLGRRRPGGAAPRGRRAAGVRRGGGRGRPRVSPAGRHAGADRRRVCPARPACAGQSGRPPSAASSTASRWRTGARSPRRRSSPAARSR